MYFGFVCSFAEILKKEKNSLTFQIKKCGSRFVVSGDKNFGRMEKLSRRIESPITCVNVMDFEKGKQNHELGLCHN